MSNLDLTFILFDGVSAAEIFLGALRIQIVDKDSKLKVVNPADGDHLAALTTKQ